MQKFEIRTAEDDRTPIYFGLTASGTLFFALADYIANDYASLLMKLNDLLRQVLLPKFEFTLILALISLGVIALISCWFYRTSNRRDAFLRGVAMLALLMIVLPYQMKEPVSRSPIINTPIRTLSFPGYSVSSEEAKVSATGARVHISWDPGAKPLESAYVTLRDANSGTILGREFVAGRVMNIYRSEGSYRLEFEVDGHRRGSVDLKIGARHRTYDVLLASSAIPIFIQRFYSPMPMELRALD